MNIIWVSEWTFPTNKLDKSLERVLSALCYRSLPLSSPHHTSQQAAELVFEPTMERPQKLEPPLPKKKRKEKKKQETRGMNSTNLNLVMLGLSKKMLEKVLFSAFSSPSRGTLRETIFHLSKATWISLCRCTEYLRSCTVSAFWVLSIAFFS